MNTFETPPAVLKNNKVSMSALNTSREICPLTLSVDRKRLTFTKEVTKFVLKLVTKQYIYIIGGGWRVASAKIVV